MQARSAALHSDADRTVSFDTCLEQQLALCRALETLADSLPSRVDTRAAMHLTGQLADTLRQCHQREETVIFPTLLRDDPAMQPVLDRLRQEHQEDEDHAEDIQEAIDAFVLGQTRQEVENLGYMLRGLFTSLRRHLAFDRDVILPHYLRISRD